MRIPDIRSRLIELADETGIDELRGLAEATKRRYHGRKAPVVSDAVTQELAEAVRAYCVAFPDKPMHEISTLFRLNQGRVSEILYGKRA